MSDSPPSSTVHPKFGDSTKNAAFQSISCEENHQFPVKTDWKGNQKQENGDIDQKSSEREEESKSLRLSDKNEESKEDIRVDLESCDKITEKPKKTLKEECEVKSKDNGLNFDYR